jgi:putative hydrolase of the HAD superfamily
VLGNPHARAPLTWLIDLDNTLHDALSVVMPAINREMTGWIARTLSLPEHCADQMRRHYWQRYGATLLGLVRHHEIDAVSFLHQTHPDRQELQASVRLASGLRQALRGLPGRRIILTNAPRHYAHAVLQHLGLAGVVQGVVTIEQMRFGGRWMPKPSRAMLRRIVARHRLDARRCVMVEDSVQNLHAAGTLGMRTVLIQRWAWRGRAGSRPMAGRGRRIGFQIQSPLGLPRLALR